jgi:hypothetical protein
MLKNPIIFALYCKENLRQEVQAQAEKLYPEGTFFCAEPAEFANAIAFVQANKAALNIKRVNIFAVLDETAADIHKISQFSENFTAVDITIICVGKNEQFLSSATLTDKIFVLTPRNERDEVFPEPRLCEIIAALPLIHATDTRFSESLAAKIQDRPLFASAGFWQKPPPKYAENRALHKLAESMEEEIREGRKTAGTLSPHPCELFEKSSTKTLTFQIQSDMVSVSAVPLRGWGLWGKSVKEAEKLLFGGEARKFFERNFANNNEFLMEIDCICDKKPLREVVAKEREMVQNISKSANEIVATESEIAHLENFKIGFCKSVDYVKDKVGELYELRYKLYELQRVHGQFSEEHSVLVAYLENIRNTIKNIKKLPVEENENVPENIRAEAERLAPLAISLLRDDGLLRETHIVPNENGDPRVLRLVGGFALQDVF